MWAQSPHSIKVNTMTPEAVYEQLVFLRLNDFENNMKESFIDIVQDYLNRHPEMDARCDKGGNCRFLTTESENKFEESASIFLGRQDIKVKSIALE